MILPILTHPHDVLRNGTEKLLSFGNPKLQKLVRNMRETMIHAEGIGIAAPQVGSSLRLAIVAASNERERIIVNARIVRRSWRKWSMDEGCLSVPGKFGPVRRPWAITVEYQDVDGVSHRERVEGMLARVFQHEIDHLDGMLFIDRAKRIEEREKKRL